MICTWWTGYISKKVNPSDLSMTTVCSASDFTSDGTSSGTAGGLLNTAGIAIHASAGMLRGAPGAHVSVTKMAHRLITPEELKKMTEKLSLSKGFISCVSAQQRSRLRLLLLSLSRYLTETGKTAE